MKKKIKDSQGNVTEFVTYKIRGKEYGYPVLKRDIGACLDMLDYIDEQCNTINEFLIRAGAWIESCDMNAKSTNAMQEEIKVYANTIFNERIYDVVKETSLELKENKLLEWLSNKNFNLIDYENNLSALEKFISDAISNGASYTMIISWIPKFKKIKSFMKDPSKGDYEDYNHCVESFYITNNLYKENIE